MKDTKGMKSSAVKWSVLWIGLALVFNVGVYVAMGPEKGTEFFTAYLVEKSLSLDNLYIFLLIFTYFKVPERLQRKVLNLGIATACVLRFVLIFAGITLIGMFHWMTYLLGLIVGFTGFKLIFQKKQDVSFENSWLVRLVRRLFKVTDDYVGDQLVVKKDSKRWITPLFLVLVVIEGTDLVFALDSIPAVLAITQNKFIAYTSNIFAVLGLRSLYFVMAAWFNSLARLKSALGTILVFIGVKFIVDPFYHISIGISLSVVVLIFSIAFLRRSKS